MRFMIFAKATQTSETGAMPSQELIEAMGKYNQELIASGINARRRRAAAVQGFV